MVNRIKPPPIVSLASRKGGVAKTAVTVNCAAALGELGHRVLVVDLDSQSNCSHWLGIGENKNLAEALIDGVRLEPVKTPVPGVDLIPSSGLALAKAERILAGEVGAETLLKTALERILPGGWDIVLIDTPPALSLPTMAALVASNEIIVPVESSALALQGVAGIFVALKAVRRLNESVKIAGILMARMDRTRLAREVLESLKKKFEGKLIPHLIRDRVTIRESWGYRKPVTMYDPDGDAANDYRDLARWMATRYIAAKRAIGEGNALQATREGDAIHATT